MLKTLKPTPIKPKPAEDWSLEISERAYNKMRDERIKLSLEVRAKSQLLEELIRKERAMHFLLRDAEAFRKARNEN